MTTPSTPRKAGPLLGNDVQYLWPFSFKVFAEGDIAVTIADSAGTETPLVLNTHYTVALNANQETSPGGTVTYPISGAKLPTGSVLAIVGDIDYDQPLDLPSGGNFSPLALENQLDRTTMQIQQLAEELDRAVRLPVTSSEDAESLVADIGLLADHINEIDTVAENITTVNVVAADLSEPVSEINTVAEAIVNVNAVGTNINNVNMVAANTTNINAVATNMADVTAAADINARYQGEHAADPVLRNNGSALQPGDLYFNTTENALRAYSGTVWVAGVAGSVSVQTFSGDGVTTVFALTTAPVSENNAQIYIDGVYQQKSRFSIVGTTLTFSAAPPAGADNIEVVTVAALALGETDAALVSTADSGGLWTTVQGFINKIVSSAGAAVVGFIQAGVAAVQRTVQDKLRERVSVFDFMTAAQIADVKAGTLLLDVTAAIQAAIDSVAAFGGIVRLPEGQYKVTAPILMKSGVSLIGDGYWKGADAAREGVSSIFAHHTGAAMLSLKGAIGCTVSNISLQGSQTAKPKTGILLGRSSADSAGYHTIRKVSVCGWYTVAAIYTIASEDNYWEDVFAWNFGGDAAYGLVTSTQDVFAVDGLVTSTNLNNTFVELRLVTTSPVVNSAGILMEGALEMGSWNFFGCYLTQYAGAYIRINNGQVDGTAMFGPVTFSGVSGEPMAGGDPLFGIDLSAPVPVTLAGLSITGARFQLGAGTNHYDIRQNTNVTLDQPNIVIQPPEAFPYALSEVLRTKIKGGVVSVGRANAWTAPTFAGSWANQYGAPYIQAAYSLDAMGVVRLRGTVGGGTGAIFTLPAEYRPPANMFFPVYATAGMGRVLITATTGVVSLATGTATEVDLSTIQFRTV